MTTMELIDRVAREVNGDRCRMCCNSIDDCNRYYNQCLGHVCRAARSNPGTILALAEQINDLILMAGMYP